MNQNKVLIVGAGFGGLEIARRLKNSSAHVTIVDRMNHHLFQPLLYQVATCALSPSDIAFSIRSICSRSKNTEVVMATVEDIDKDNKFVTLADGTHLYFDTLILAPGASHSYFNHPEWEQYAPGLKTIRDAQHIREKILMAFEKAERASSFDMALPYLRFAIVGGGPTGVEMAGAIAEIAFKSLAKEYKKTKLEHATIFLLEGADQILPGYPKKLALKAQKALEKLGVVVMCDTLVTNVCEDGVFIGSEFISASTVIWAAGNQASPLLAKLNMPCDRQGRVIVEPDLSIAGYDNIFVIGDAASCKGKDGKPLVGLAPVAKQQGIHVAKIIKNSIPKNARKPFRYFDKGSLATIGKGKAVGVIGKVQLSGFIAWLAWSFIHILYLMGFTNRILVLVQWMYSFLTGRRKVQLIVRPVDKEHLKF